LKTDDKAKLAELKVELRAHEKGYIVSRPTKPARYDLIIDCSGRLYRVQVKYGGGKSLNSTGVVVVNLRSYVGNKSTDFKVYSASEVDILAVYLPELDKICWLSPEVFENKNALYLRTQISKNNQRQKCYFVDDFVW
jgi:hypothetical protein